MRVPFAAAVLSMALAGAARADEIVVNGGFEDPVGRGTFYNGLNSNGVSDWHTLSGSEPMFRQTVGSPYGENQVETAKIGAGPDYNWLPANTNGGVWAFMLQSYGGGYNGTKQDLGAIVAGTTYTVSADFARNSGGSSMNYDFFLMDGTANTALAGIDEVTGGVPAVGTWVNKSFSYTATSGVAGHELWIVLRARVPASDVTRGGIDNVSVITTAAGSSSKVILSFDIGSSIGAVDTVNHTVAVVVPYGTWGTGEFTPTIEVSPLASISPTSGTAQSFTTVPVTYTVKAEDNSTQEYQVTVTEALPRTDKQITSFTIGTSSGVINHVDHTVAVVVPYGTWGTGEFTPTIEVSAGATVSPTSGTAQSFTTNPVTYTVKAEDNSTQEYLVTVTEGPNNIVQNGGFEDPVGRSAWFSGLSSPSQGDPRPTAWQDLSGSEPILFQTVGSMGGGENGVETGQLGTSYDYLPVNGSVWGFFLQGYGGGYNGTKQDLGGIVAGTTYTVTADFARDHVVNPMQYDLFLMDGTANTALAGIDEVTGGVPAGGVWANKSFSYTATSADAGHELWIVLRARTASNSIRGGIDNVVVTATAGTTTTSYATWAGLNSASTDPGADSNKNGVPNGIEFFMGATPGNPAKLPSLVGANGSWTWTIPYDPQAAASYKFQISGDLSPTGWTDVVPPDARIHVTPPVVPATLGSVQLTLPAGSDRKFCRLVVTPAP